MKLYKLKLTIAYDGSKFYGSQIQRTQKLPTIVGNFELALKKLQIKPKIEFSGRTDRGVHATNQIATIEVKTHWQKDLNKLKNSLNKIIKPSIIIKHIENCDESFHPRFDAKKRIYRYVISTQEFNPFMNNYITFLKTIDEKEIKKAIKLFEGVHDFEYFKKSGDELDSYIREIYKTKFYKYKKNFYIFYFEGNGFLRSQIRMMVDFLLKISDKKLTNADLIKQLNKKELLNRNLAPPNGLYLARIKYN